jgi:hypothetical protein
MKGLETTISYKSNPDEISTTWTYELVGGRRILKSVDIHYPKGYTPIKRKKKP